MPTIMELGVLFAQFSMLPDSQKGDFIRQHPEIKSEGLVDWALMAADLRERMGEPEAKQRLLNAALYVATVMGDRARQARAREMLAGK